MRNNTQEQKNLFQEDSQHSNIMNKMQGNFHSTK